MKKLYLLLINSLVLLAGIGTLVITVAGCDHKKKKEGKKTTVYDALKKFDKDHPLEIPHHLQAPTAPASELAHEIKSAMKQEDRIFFTTTVLDNIDFEDNPLIPGKVVIVRVFYNKDKKRPVDIYVKQDSEVTLVHKTLKKFDKDHPLEIPFQGGKSKAKVSDEAITKSIRETLRVKKPIILSENVVKKITFNDVALATDTTVEVEATYKDQKASIYIKEPATDEAGVFDALKKFDKDHPLEIPFQGGKSKAKVSDEAITKTIKNLMKLEDVIFTDEVLAKIKFDDTLLVKNTPVLVTVTYNSDKKKPVPIAIHIKEQSNALSTLVSNVIKKFYESKPVLIDAKYDQRFADEFKIRGKLENKAGDAIRVYI